MAEEQVVGNNLVAMLSLTAIDILESGSELQVLSGRSLERQTKALIAAFSSAIFLKLREGILVEGLHFEVSVRIEDV